MPGGDREANLRNAILCYSGALYVFRSQYMDAHMKRVMADIALYGMLDQITSFMKLLELVGEI